MPNSPEVTSVVDQLLPALGAGKVVIDTSTIDPEVEREQHRRVAATGAGYLDAPLSGGTVGRRARHSHRHGRRRCRRCSSPSARPSTPVSSLVVHVGGPGMGQVVKLCNNLIYAAQMLATAEATALALRSGADPSQLLEVLTHSTGDCVAVRTRLPVAGVDRREPGVERLEAGVHDRPDGEGSRPRPRLRGARRCPARVDGHRAPGADRGVGGRIRARGLLGAFEGGDEAGRDRLSRAWLSRSAGPRERNHRKARRPACR